MIVARRLSLYRASGRSLYHVRMCIFLQDGHPVPVEVSPQTGVARRVTLIRDRLPSCRFPSHVELLLRTWRVLRIKEIDVFAGS